MATERRRLRQTLGFLRVSYEAIQQSIGGRLDDPLPCWLDTSLLAMLSRELKSCYWMAVPLSDTSSHHLSTAWKQSECLLGQCPGMLNSALCYRQLDALLLSLAAAIVELEKPSPRHWTWKRR